MRLSCLLLVTCLVMSVNTSMADEALIQRARIAIADKEAELEPHGNLLAHYADSLRTVDFALAAKCLEVSGIAAFRTNQLDSAVVRWQRGVDWASEANEIRAESSLLNALAIGYTMRGDVEGALPIYDRTLEVRESLADTVGLSRTWGNLATAYSNMGRTAEALAATSEEEKWLAYVHNPKGLIGNAIRRSQILIHQGRLDEALLAGREAVDLAVEYDDDGVKGMAAMAYGNALLDLGKYDESLRVLGESLAFLRSSGDDYSALFIEQSIINGLIMLQRYEDALDRLEAVVPEVEAAGQIPLLTVLRRYEGVALFELGRIDKAETKLRAALVVFEERRDSLEDDRSRSGMFIASGELYSQLARCLLAKGQTEEAFAIIERGRGAVFRDHGSGKVATLDELKTELSKSSTALVLFNDPVAEPLVAYVLDNNGVRTVDLGLPHQIKADAKAALRLLVAGESLETCLPALERLENSLSRPVLNMVDSKVKRFAIVPPSFLTGFPLGILRDSQGIGWAETRPISYLPNATSMLDLGARVAPEGGVLAFADPAAPKLSQGRLPMSSARSQSGIALPEARTEIAEFTTKNSQRRVGADASGVALRQALESKLAVLHLATHAIVDPIDGGRSAVVMAGTDDIDIVTAQEISTFNFQGDLVVLSGCSTFGNHQVLGEGWFGLPRSFLAAGARSVVSTLWDVDDLGARQFVTAFYDALGNGASRDEALMKAREVCRNNGMPPRDWAAFVLTGVGGEGVPLLAETDSSSNTLLMILVLGLAGAIVLVMVLRR